MLTSGLKLEGIGIAELTFAAAVIIFIILYGVYKKGGRNMQLKEYFPIWNQLTAQQQELISGHAYLRNAAKGTVVHNGELECTGLLLVRSGQFRAYILSDEGREITIYRLFERDVCLFSAACMMNSIQFSITVEAEKDAEFWVVSPDAYKKVMNESAALANYTNEIMAARFSEVMWLMEQVMWKSMDKRVADFLLEEMSIEGTARLKITHETIANHLGTHREVVTRMLRYLQNEGLVKLTRGTVEIVDEQGLRKLK